MHITHCLGEQGLLGKGKGCVLCQKEGVLWQHFQKPSSPEVHGLKSQLVAHIWESWAPAYGFRDGLKRLVGKPDDLCNVKIHRPQRRKGGTVIKHVGEMLQALPGGHGERIL